MIIFLDAQETADRFGDYIEELRAILVANNIKFGSPDNFSEFARRLQSDDLLPGDLSRMVKFIVERERGEVSPKTILTIIAIAVGGSAVAEPDRDLSKPASLVLDFLSRTGICSPSDLEHMDNMCTAPSTAAKNLSEKIRAPIEDAAQLLQSLTRLEFSAQQARLHLGSIEQRIGKIKPRTENVPPLVSKSPNQNSTPPTKPHSADFLLKHSSPPSDPPFPSFVHRASTQAKEHMAWIFLLSEKFAAVPVLATIAGGTLLYIGYPRNSPKTALPPPPSTPAATINPTPVPDGLIFVVTPTPTEATTQDTVKPAKPSAGYPKTNTLDSKTIKTYVGRTLKPTEPPANDATPHSTSSLNAEAAEAPQVQGSTEMVPKARRDVSYPLARVSTRSAPSPRIVNVSSGVMAANLVSASPPSYPKLAGLTHMQGKVIMQAIISKDGTVQNLQVIQGHRLLRNAAKNSARTWRYRPYLVNGKPVEVATIVSVDFTLGH